MNRSFTLPRVIQCAKCPWKKSTNPRDIPNGYCEIKHRALSDTIVSGLQRGPLRAMACHHSSGDDNMYCVGYLANQLGPGNNIGLRLRMRDCANIGQIRLKGPQHESFEETLPAQL